MAIARPLQVESHDEGAARAPRAGGGARHRNCAAARGGDRDGPRRRTEFARRGPEIARLPGIPLGCASSSCWPTAAREEGFELVLGFARPKPGLAIFQITRAEENLPFVDEPTGCSRVVWGSPRARIRAPAIAGSAVAQQLGALGIDGWFGRAPSCCCLWRVGLERRAPDARHGPSDGLDCWTRTVTDMVVVCRHGRLAPASAPPRSHPSVSVRRAGGLYARRQSRRPRGAWRRAARPSVASSLAEAGRRPEENAGLKAGGRRPGPSGGKCWR